MDLQLGVNTQLLEEMLLVIVEEEDKSPGSQAGYVCGTVAKKRTCICQDSLGTG